MPCSSDPSTTSFRLTGMSSPSARRRGQVHDDVALAVGGAAPVPAPVPLGQRERWGPPGLLVQRRLDVVVGVEQHGRSAEVGGRPGADHRPAAVRGLGQLDVDEPELGEPVEHPLRRAGALLRRELPRVGDGPDRHQLGQVGMRPSHEAGHPVPQLHPDHSAGTGISAAGTPVHPGRRGGSGAASTATTNRTTTSPSTDPADDGRGQVRRDDEQDHGRRPRPPRGWRRPAGPPTC